MSRLRRLSGGVLLCLAALCGCGEGEGAPSEPASASIEVSRDAGEASTTAIPKIPVERAPDAGASGYEEYMLIDQLQTSKDAAGIAQYLEHADEGVRRKAATVLMELGPDAAPAVSRLAALVAREPKGVGVEAAEALAAVGPKAVPELGRLLTGTDEGAIVLAAEALGDIGPQAAPAVPALAALIETRDDLASRAAFEALPWIGQGAKAAVPSLERAMARKRFSTDGEAEQSVLSRIDPERFDPKWPALAPWVDLAVKKRLPLPELLVLQRETSTGTIVILDSRRRRGRGARFEHTYLVGLSGPSGPSDLARVAAMTDLGEKPVVTLESHEAYGVPLAVELGMDNQSDPETRFDTGALIALPSLARIATFTANLEEVSEGGEDTTGEFSYVELRPSKQEGKVDAFLMTQKIEAPPGTSPRKKLLTRFSKPTAGPPPDNAEIERALEAAVPPEACGKAMTCDGVLCTDENCLGPKELALNIKEEKKPFDIETVSPRLMDGRWLVLYARHCRREYLEGGAFHVSAITIGRDGALRVEKTVELPKRAAKEKWDSGSIEVRDFDLDDVEEALVLYSSGDHGGEFCVGLPWEREYAAVLRLADLSPSFDVALTEKPFELGSPVTGKLAWRDANRDGHPDIVVEKSRGASWDCVASGIDCGPGGAKEETKSEEVFLFDEESDAWKAR